MPNYPSPYALRYKYNHDGLDHKGEVLVQLGETPSVGEIFSTIVTSTKAGGASDLQTFATAYFTAIKALYADTTVFSNLELWKYEENSFDSSYVASSPTTYSGTNAGDNVTSHQQIMSFRSRNGGIAKIYLLENAQNNETKLAYGAMNSAEQDFADVILAGTSPVVARDNGFLASLNYMSGGQNEKIWKIRNR